METENQADTGGLRAPRSWCMMMMMIFFGHHFHHQN